MDFGKQPQSLSKMLDTSPGCVDSNFEPSSDSEAKKRKKNHVALPGGEITTFKRSYKDMVYSPKTEFSPGRISSKSPKSNSSQIRTPVTIDLTKIDFPKLRFNQESNISNNSKSDQMLSDSFLNTSIVRAHLIEPLFGVDFQNFKVQEDRKSVG